MWGWGRLRELPTVNYAESSDEEVAEEDLQSGLNFHSPLQSPRRPQTTREGSPVGIVIGGPTLADNVDDELEEVQYKLHDIAVVREEVEEVTDLLNEVDTRVGRENSEVASEVGTEVEDCGLIIGTPQIDNCQEPSDEESDTSEDNMAIFEDEDGADDAGALGNALRQLEKLEWDSTDIPFFFNKAETRMSVAGVKKNFTKFQVLSEIIPKKVEDQVKSLLRKSEADFPQKDAYKQLKAAILKIFGPRLEDGMDRAMNRVLSGKPSELARDLVGDICKHELTCDCCPAIVSSMWKRHLPSQVRAGIAHMMFSKENFDSIVQLADDIFANTTQPASVSAIRGAAASSPLNETQPGLQYPVPEVAAFRNSRGRGRGGRGRGSRGRGQPQQQQQPRHRGAKHPDLPAGEWRGCGMHFKFGKGAYFCSDPSSCPWKDIYASKPAKQ